MTHIEDRCMGRKTGVSVLIHKSSNAMTKANTEAMTEASFFTRIGML
jgi:hypothetical protein